VLAVVAEETTLLKGRRKLEMMADQREFLRKRLRLGRKNRTYDCKDRILKLRAFLALVSESILGKKVSLRLLV